MRKNLLLNALGGFAAAVLTASFANIRDSAAALDCQFVAFVYSGTIKACNEGHAGSCRLLPAHKQNYDKCVVESMKSPGIESPPPKGDKTDTAQPEEEKKKRRCSEGLAAADEAVIQKIAEMNRAAKATQSVIALSPFTGLSSADSLDAAITALTTDPSLHVEAMVGMGKINACSITLMIEEHLNATKDNEGCREIFFRKIQQPYIQICSE